MRKAVADFGAGKIEAADVERTRQASRIGWQLQIESMLGRADALARDFDVSGEASTGLGDDPVLEALTAEDVMAAFRQYVVPDQLSVLTILPGPRGDYPEALKASSGEPAPLPAAARPSVDIPVLTAGAAERSELPPAQRAELSNGIEIVHYRMDGAPLALLAATVPGGVTSDRPGKEGLIGLTAELMARGAGERDFEAFTKAASDIGAKISGQVGLGLSAVVLAVPPARLGGGAELMADTLLRPRLDPTEWQALVAETQQSLAYVETHPQAVGQLALERLLFPASADRPALTATAASVAALTLADAQAMHRQLFTPAAMTVYSVGDFDVGLVKDELERVLGAWSEAGPAMVSVPHPSPSLPTTRRVLIVPSLGNSQATIYVARAAPGFNDPGLIGAVAVAEFLGGGANSRLNTVLRETKGLSYGVDARVRVAIPSHGLLTVTAPVQADRLGDALADISAGFAGLATEPVTAAELRRTAMNSATSQAGAIETSSGLFGTVLGAATMGVPPEAMTAKLDEMVALELGDAQEWGRRLSSLEAALIVISGDPASILPQLEAIGITDATVMVPEAEARLGG